MSRDPLDPTSDTRSSGRSNRDLIAAALYAVLASALLIVGAGLPAAIRVPVALPLLLFVPGYAVVTALLPANRAAGIAPGSGRADGLERSPPGGYDGLSTLERYTLSLVTSVGIVPTVALLAAVLVGVDLVPILIGVTLVTLLSAVLAATRRTGTAGREAADATGTDGPTFAGPAAWLPTDAVTIAAVAVSILLLATSAAVAFSGPGPNAGTTELSVGSESGGEFVADGYPETLQPGETETVDVAVEHGGETAREYEVVATLDAVEYANASAGGNDTTAAPGADGDGTTVTATAELDRYSTTVEPDERAIDAVELDPTAASGALGAAENHRVTILLYEDEAPAEPDQEAAHRTVSLPVEVGGA